MKIKFFLIYVIVGAAFLGASLWVILSRGKSARAVRTKYRLGGIMLSAAAVLSAPSCSLISGLLHTVTPQVTCYEPVMPDEDRVYIYVPDADQVRPGDIISINIAGATRMRYFLLVEQEGGTEVLQKSVLDVTDYNDVHFEVPLAETITYKGKAWLTVQGATSEKPEHGTQLYSLSITIR